VAYEFKYKLEFLSIRLSEESLCSVETVVHNKLFRCSHGHHSSSFGIQMALQNSEGDAQRGR